MQHFTERKHLIRWLMQNCTRKSVVRAMDEGAVEHLGAFANLGPNKDFGWIVRVESNTGKIWNVEVVVSVHSRRYGIFITDSAVDISWGNWLGRNRTVAEHNPLHDGDRPAEYTRLRDEYKEQKEQKK